NFIRQFSEFMATPFIPQHRLDRFDRKQQHPRTAHPLFAGQSDTWRNEMNTWWGRKTTAEATELIAQEASVSGN
ncbi:MAG TPA: hypothetical protein VGS97_19710, partial [Actinocrinis sp.]